MSDDWNPNAMKNPPGSREAQAVGCTCDSFANSFGAGLGEPNRGVRQFAVSVTCPIHWGPNVKGDS